MRSKWLGRLSGMLALLTAMAAVQAEDLYIKKIMSHGGNVLSTFD